MALAALVLVAPAIALAAVRTERVAFPKDKSSVAVKGSISGDASVHYLVAAEAGTTMTIALSASNAQNFFNVTAPGTRTAMFNGAALGNRFSAKLPLTGDYVVQVYLVESAKRKATSKYTLTFDVAK